MNRLLTRSKSRFATATFLIGCLIALGLSGCALQSHPDPAQQTVSDSPPPPPPVNPQLMRLLSYYQELSRQSAAAIEREWGFYRAALLAGQCDTARMRLGLVLLRANELELELESDEDILHSCVYAAEQASGIPLLAQLIQAQLLQRTDKETHRQEAAHAIESLKKENQELRRQVDGLKAIERSLQSRRHLE